MRQPWGLALTIQPPPEPKPKYTRQEAKRRGCPRYWNDNPCINGHIDFRRTSNGECVVCNYVRSIKPHA